MRARIIDWLTKLLTSASDNRTASRVSVPGVVAHYWDGSAPSAHTFRDVSLTGAYLYTSERWYPGTIVRLLLQHTAHTGDNDAGVGMSVSIPARVVRHGTDGVALDFVFGTSEDQVLLARLITAVGNNNLTAKAADAPQPTLESRQ